MLHVATLLFGIYSRRCTCSVSDHCFLGLELSWVSCFVPWWAASSPHLPPLFAHTAPLMSRMNVALFCCCSRLLFSLGWLGLGKRMSPGWVTSKLIWDMGPAHAAPRLQNGACSFGKAERGTFGHGGFTFDSLKMVSDGFRNSLARIWETWPMHCLSNDPISTLLTTHA